MSDLRVSDPTPERTLRQRATRGAAWSGLSTIVLRLGSLTVGIILARLLMPEQFGVYAVALTVQSILVSVADLGLSADIIRSDRPRQIAPTVASLSLAMGLIITIATFTSSGALAQLLGSPEAGPAIAVLSFTLLLASVSVVPYAMLQRRFQQREMFYIGVADFVVSTTVTLLLVATGWGVLGLAVGRVAAQLVSSVLQFILAREIPRFGIDRTLVRPVLAFGLPIAGANLLSWALLNVDNIILARVVGATALGYYVLAFNISSWPMSALAQVVRSISLPYFSRTDNGSAGLASLTGIAWAAALPAGAMLAALSAPLIETVYGAKWLPAAPVLAALGLYGSLRVVFDIFAGYLYARGRSRPVFVIQVIWLVALASGMVAATTAFGIIGAAWVHVAIGVVVVLPCYWYVVHTTGATIVPFLRAMWPATLATIPATAVALLARWMIDDAPVALVAGGGGAAAIYLLLMWPWLRKNLRRVRSAEPEVAVGVAS